MTYVVHLEDDGPLREILKVAFQATDPNVNLKQFISSDEVVAHIKPNIQLIDLFVLDIRVPGSMDGLDVARKIREFGSDAPIILTSAYRTPDRELIESLKLEWMSKPWHIMEIAQRLVKLARDQRAKAAKAPVKAAAANVPALNTPAASQPIANVPTVKPAATNAPVSNIPAASPAASNPPAMNPIVPKTSAPTPAASSSPAPNPLSPNNQPATDAPTVNPPAPNSQATGKT